MEKIESMNYEELRELKDSINSKVKSVEKIATFNGLYAFLRSNDSFLVELKRDKIMSNEYKLTMAIEKINEHLDKINNALTETEEKTEDQPEKN